MVSETLMIDEEIRAYIMSKVPIKDFMHYVRSKGMITMYEDGMEKVYKGLTTKEEVLRVLHD